MCSTSGGLEVRKQVVQQTCVLCTASDTTFEIYTEIGISPQHDKIRSTAQYTYKSWLKLNENKQLEKNMDVLNHMFCETALPTFKPRKTIVAVHKLWQLSKQTKSDFFYLMLIRIISNK